MLHSYNILKKLKEIDEFRLNDISTLNIGSVTGELKKLHVRNW